MRIGYVSLALGVPGTELRSTVLKNATPARLTEVVLSNLAALDRILDYNRRQNIRMLRVSSDIIPFASHPDVAFPWRCLFAEQLAALGKKARAADIRLSMHPGQYTVLNSPSGDVVGRAVEDLRYHTDFLDLLGMDGTCKVILHVGGAYGDKTAATARFQKNYAELDDGIRRRLVLENDDRIYNAEAVLALAGALDVPMVFDNLHHEINPSKRALAAPEWVALCGKTWHKADGAQKIHYSQQQPHKRPGAHSGTIRVAPFLAFVNQLAGDVDIMLEVKDKNLSAVKCVLCTSAGDVTHPLEKEWALYKYAVLEHSASIYNEIRTLLNTRGPVSPVAFYGKVETALQTPFTHGSCMNAAQHVWGYFKKDVTPKEKQSFAALLGAGEEGAVPFARVKRFLHRLALKYHQPYMLSSYYFLPENP